MFYKRRKCCCCKPNTNIEVLGEDCLIHIFLFVNNKIILNICLTSKYFNNIIENTVFWKLRLKQSKSWKQLCKVHTTQIDPINSKELRAFSFISLNRRILKSKMYIYFLTMIKKIASMGYWGIYLSTSRLGNTLKCPYRKRNNFRYFDFHRDNDNQIYFSIDETIDDILSFAISDLSETSKYINNCGIDFEIERFGGRGISLNVSWEKIEDEAICNIL